MSIFQNIHILIHIAGTVVANPFGKRSREKIERTIQINLTSAMHVSRAFRPAMHQQSPGLIVNIASAARLIPNPDMAVCTSSKGGLIGWSESLRVELSQQKNDIKVTMVKPSFINTGMFEGVTPPRLTPLLEPDDIVDRVTHAIKHNKIQLRAPFKVKLIPFLKSILPRPLFDIVAGKLFMVYRLMNIFKGRNSST